MENNPLLAVGAPPESMEYEKGSNLCADDSCHTQQRSRPWRSTAANLLRPIGVGLLAGAVLVVAASGARLLSKRGASLRKGDVVGDVTNLAESLPPISCNGGHDQNALNNFNAGFDAMQAAGWVFAPDTDGGAWEQSSRYRPSVQAACADCPTPDPNSYWGWDFPGNGHLELPLTGSGAILLDFGNAYNTGVVIASLNGSVPVECPPKTLSKFTVFTFKGGDKLVLIERKPRAIMVVNSIHFFCTESEAISHKTTLQAQLAATAPPTSAVAVPVIPGATPNSPASSLLPAGPGATPTIPGAPSLPAMPGDTPNIPGEPLLPTNPTSASGATATVTGMGVMGAEVGMVVTLAGKGWKIVKAEEWQCPQEKLCVSGQQEALPWGSEGAASLRNSCAMACAFDQQCEGFLYPDPGTPADHCLLVSKSESACTSSALCDEDLSLWQHLRRS